MNYIPADRTQPRVKKKFTTVLNTKSVNEFKKLFPEHKDVTYKEMVDIINKFNQNIVQTVIDERNGVILPERLGHMIIAGFKRPVGRKAIDWGESRKASRIVYHMNWETDNRIGKIVYQPAVGHHNALTKLWCFTATRSFTTTMSTAFKKFYNRYIFVRKSMHIELKVS
jgi:hypothetical protein